MLRSVVEAVGRLRRFVGRLAGSEGAQADDLGIHAGGERQCGHDRWRSISPSRKESSCWRLVLARIRTKRHGMPPPAFSDGFEKAKACYIAGWQESHREALLAEGQQSRRRTIFRGRASPFCARMSPRRRRGLSSPASRSPGERARVTRIWVVTISSGRATWWKRPALCWPWARTRMHAAYSLICRRRSCPTGTGRRTCGWMARPIGMESKWTRRHCRFSWWISPIAKRHWPRPTWRCFGRWCGRLRAIWFATAR